MHNLGECGYFGCLKGRVYVHQAHIDHRDPKRPADDRLWHYECYAYDFGLDLDAKIEAAEEAAMYRVEVE